jgi:hypothetical protein
MQHQYTTCESPDTSPNTTRVTSCSRTLSSRAKAVTVTVLAWLLAWRPSLAMALGRLVLRVWPNFRKA